MRQGRSQSSCGRDVRSTTSMRRAGISERRIYGIGGRRHGDAGAGIVAGGMAESTKELLRAFLVGRDVLCPACGYNLRDLLGERCPECGEEVVLQVGLVEPRHAAAIAGVIGLAAGAGMSGLLLVYLFVQAVLY